MISFEEFGNYFMLLATVIGLMLCLFRYVTYPGKGWIYGVAFLLSNLLSNYYWAVYVIIMKDDPKVSSFMAYFGWNLGYIFAFLLLRHLQTDEERRYVNPLMFLPIPINAYQFCLYLPYGGLLNNIWQNVLCTLISVMSLQSILYYFKKREKGVRVPYVAFVFLLFVTCEYGMWTSSCFDWPEDICNPYYYFSFVSFGLYVVLVWALQKTYAYGAKKPGRSERKMRILVKAVFAVIVLGCCQTGYHVAIWMKKLLNLSTEYSSEAASMVAVMLFGVSVFLVALVMAVICIIAFRNKDRESAVLREKELVALKSNAAKSRFLANMSHEIRTPINAVMGMNEMILRESESGHDREAFRTIHQYADNALSAGNSLLALVNDILDFSRIESGKLQIVEAQYQLSSVINDLSNMILFKARSKGLDFSLQVDEHLPEDLYGDEVRLRQVVVNILNNAVKYTERGEVVMSVYSAGTYSQDGAEIVDLIFEVRDTGTGIKKEDLPRLFDRFERLDVDRNNSVPGTGLGLSIVKNLLDMMGGRVEVKSRYNEGSIFTVILPQRVMSKEKIGDFRSRFEKSLHSDVAEERIVSANDIRILLVDDTRMNITVVKSLLKETGIQIDAVLSGMDALDLAENIDYDLILLDQRMPGMDGIQTLKKLREQEKNVDTPVICLTADAVVGARERYISEGFTDYLTKPVDPSSLNKKLIQYLPADRLEVKIEDSAGPGANAGPDVNAGLGANAAGFSAGKGAHDEAVLSADAARMAEKHFKPSGISTGMDPGMAAAGAADGYDSYDPDRYSDPGYVEEKEDEKDEETGFLHGRRKSTVNFIVTLLATFVLMVFAVVYTSSLVYRISVTNIMEAGTEKASSTAASLDNYLDTAKSTVQVTADTVEDMMLNGDSTERIGNYLVRETERLKSQFDTNLTGLYGYVNGEYLDGLNWVPPEGYDPVERDWYKAAKAGGGKIVIVSPYVDAQTGDVVITIVRLLEDGESTLALDMKMNRIQEITARLDINEKGYGMVLNNDGMIVAHQDPELNGKNWTELNGNDLLDKLQDLDQGSFSTWIDPESCTVFAHRILDQWYVVIVIRDFELYSQVWTQLFINIFVSMIIFSLILLFYYVGYKNEKTYSRKMQELRISQQKKEYETRVLKLERTAAEAANKAKSSLLADMSHEIRTPINAVLGMNEMILRTSHNEEVLGYAENIDSAGKILLSLINSILDFSKIEEGKLKIIPVEYETRSLLKSLENSVSDRARKKSLDFVMKIDPGLPTVMLGDDVRLIQVVVNLLTNAVKYTEKGGVTLEVSLKERRDSEAYIGISVADTGIGIKKEEIGKLFDSFQRLDEERNRKVEGTGLGMNIVTRLLMLMGSRLEVESEYGSGSVFSFVIKQIIVDETPLGDYEKGSQLKSAARCGGGLYAPGARVLVVDDSTMNLTVVKGLLRDTAIEIDTATSGSDALTLTEDKTYDVILMDQRMPGMDGMEALGHIRKQKSGMNLDTPVICLTADAIEGMREKYLSAGFTDYLSKPIDPDALEAMLAGYLSDYIKEVPAMNTAGDRTDDDMSALAALGIDTEKGLSWCTGDRDVYMEIVADYAREAAQKAGEVRECYEKGQWKDYGILVHSIKSTSKTIGAGRLSDKAKELESAADRGDEAYIRENHEAMFSEYCSLSEGLRALFDGQGGESAGSGDMGIFEFMPE